jgi:hypothetical protein
MGFLAVTKYLIYVLIICLAFLCAAVPANRRLECRHIGEDTFQYALRTAHRYEAMRPKAGIVPHHLTAVRMIGGFFEAAKRGGAVYDTVVLVGPNHLGDIGDVIISFKDWDASGVVRCDTEIMGQMAEIRLEHGRIAENDARMENDHSLATLIPFIKHYLPDAAVAPMMVSRSLTYSDTLRLADALVEIINQSDKNILLLCSIDFSHFLTPRESKTYDMRTLAAVWRNDYAAIHPFSNAYVDSPASLIIFLRYMESLQKIPRLVDHADASRYMGAGISETTSYFVMAGE